MRQMADPSASRARARCSPEAPATSPSTGPPPARRTMPAAAARQLTPTLPRPPVPPLLPPRRPCAASRRRRRRPCCRCRRPTCAAAAPRAAPPSSTPAGLPGRLRQPSPGRPAAPAEHPRAVEVSRGRLRQCFQGLHGSSGATAPAPPRSDTALPFCLDTARFRPRGRHGLGTGRRGGAVCLCCLFGIARTHLRAGKGPGRYMAVERTCSMH